MPVAITRPELCANLADTVKQQQGEKRERASPLHAGSAQLGLPTPRSTPSGVENDWGGSALWFRPAHQGAKVTAHVAGLAESNALSAHPLPCRLADHSQVATAMGPSSAARVMPLTRSESCAVGCKHVQLLLVSVVFRLSVAGDGRGSRRKTAAIRAACPPLPEGKSPCGASRVIEVYRDFVSQGKERRGRVATGPFAGGAALDRTLPRSLYPRL